ncbi:MAG TPA: hypothetical protein VEI97_20705, partial [bacterium]|nr:hypothetical protein [bacterium]
MPALHLLLIALLAAGCSGGGKEPLAPLPGPGTPQGASESGGTGVLGIYELALDFQAAAATLTPVMPREPQAIGDLYTLDITPYLRGTPCGDCFKLQAIGLDPAGSLIADFALRHPFPDTGRRMDLDIFDARAIVISPGTDLFPGSPLVHLDGDGGGDLQVSGNFDLLLNADGYTPHFDGKVTDPRYFNPPLSIPGTVNPFIQFFTESDPAPTGTGLPIANHRFAQGAVADVQRFRFNAPNDGLTQIRVVVVLEAQYG